MPPTFITLPWMVLVVIFGFALLEKTRTRGQIPWKWGGVFLVGTVVCAILAVFIAGQLYVLLRSVGGL